MNYYPFHLGDYAAHTAHLEPLEDLAYRRMLDLYYRTEAPLPYDWRQIARLIRMRDNGPEIEAVLSEFFVLTDDGWRHARCDNEINKMQDKQAKARASAEASVKARASARSTNAQRTLNERSTNVELPTPTPTPIEDQKTLVPSEQGTAACPHEQIIEVYHEELPTSPRVKVWTPARRQQLQARWREDPKRQSLDYWRRFFCHVHGSDFLTGRAPGRNGGASFVADLEWLTKAGNFCKVIEGKYHESR